jgi:hypothetical protein
MHRDWETAPDIRNKRWRSFGRNGLPWAFWACHRNSCGSCTGIPVQLPRHPLPEAQPIARRDAAGWFNAEILGSAVKFLRWAGFHFDVRDDNSLLLEPVMPACTDDGCFAAQ